MEVGQKSEKKPLADSGKKRALLLLNLGTPDNPETPDIRRYLAEFLMDHHVVDLPALFRWLLVYGIILPTRPAKAAEAYRKIWTDRGSPLLFHLLDLVPKVQGELEKVAPGGWDVLPAMRYGNPSIPSAIREISRRYPDGTLEELVVFPLYPQYSLAATQSSIEACRKQAQSLMPGTRVRFVNPFYNFAPFIESFVEVTRETLAGFQADFVLFSFHGLPERHVKKTDLSGSHCLMFQECCASVSESNRDCYRAQSFETARLMARKLGLPPTRYQVAFQSRLGRTPWIRPYTDVVYGELARQGVRRLAVVSPSFVADCLETLEEIQIRGRDSFISQGGQDLMLVPSLNSRDRWARAVTEIVRR